jgi:hypothetical protein
VGIRRYRRHSAADMMAILRQVLLEGQAVSMVCEEHDVSPTLFYTWQKQFFENGAAAFAKEASAEQRELARIGGWTASVGALQAGPARCPHARGGGPAWERQQDTLVGPHAPSSGGPASALVEPRTVPGARWPRRALTPQPPPLPGHRR